MTTVCFTLHFMGLLDCASLTCRAARERREGGNNQLVGEVQHVSTCVAGVSQGGEADHHWVGAGAGAAKSAHLTGVWNTVDAFRPATVAAQQTEHWLTMRGRLLLTGDLLDVALRVSHVDGGIFMAEAGSSDDQQSPQTVGSCKIKLLKYTVHSQSKVWTHLMNSTSLLSFS